MNRTPNVERVLREYLADDGASAPDYVLDVVADRIGRQPQRRSRRLLRRLQMNTYVKLAAAAGVAAIAVGAVYLNLPNRHGVGATPSPSPTPTQAQPSPTFGSGPLTEGRLAAGHYTMTPIIELPSLTIAADIPAGWQGYPDVPALVSPGATSNDGVLIGFMKADGLFSDGCHWDVDGTGDSAQPGDVDVGPTVDGLVEALRANTSYTSSTRSPITIGGFEGSELELQLPGADVISTCDRRPGEQTGDFFVFGGGFYAQGPDSRWRLFIVDVDGSQLITVVSYFATTPQADVAAGQAIVESFQITP